MKKITQPWIYIVAASLLPTGAVFSAPQSSSSQTTSQASEEYKLTANFGAASNYIWRGVTQSNDQAAVSGGLDMAHRSGVYAGVWTSSLDGGNYELDLYAGYSGKTQDIEYDAGIIFYQYPVGSTNQDFTEAYVNADFNLFTVQAALTLDKDNTSQDNDLYASISTNLALKKDVDLVLLFGIYEFDADSAEDYAHFQAAISKGEYTFALDKNDKDQPASAGDMRFTASWQHAFDL